MKKNKSKALILGDFHWKNELSYSNHIKNGREKEKQEILDFIVEQSKDCKHIIFLGDQFDNKTNSSKVTKEFTNFVEKFEGKKIYMISGNHERLFQSSKISTALDYLKEIKNKEWTIITKTATKLQIGALSAVFLPYLTKPELEAKDNKEALKEISKRLEPADILFHHHTMSIDGKIAGLPLNADMLPEPVLPIKNLIKYYTLIIGGHIHVPTVINKNAIVAGSIFNDCINEKQKYIWKIDCNVKGEELIKSIEQIPLPGRAIYGIDNPTEEQLKEIPKNSIVKITLTKKRTVDEIEKLKTKLKKFDAFILLEHIPKTKKKMHYGKGEAILDFNIEELLKLYSKEKKIDYALLNRGFELIK